MEGKKKILNLGSLVRCTGFMIEFIMKLSSLVTFMSFIIFRDSLGLENSFNGLVSELRKGGRVLLYEWCYVDIVWVIYPFFEPSHLLCGLKSFIIDFLILGVNFHLLNH